MFSKKKKAFLMYVKMRKSFILQNIPRDLFAEEDQEAFQLNAEKQTLSS